MEMDLTFSASQAFPNVEPQPSPPAGFSSGIMSRSPGKGREWPKRIEAQNRTRVSKWIKMRKEGNPGMELEKGPKKRE